jgi:hypothetical protein
LYLHRATGILWNSEGILGILEFCGILGTVYISFYGFLFLIQ